MGVVSVGRNLVIRQLLLAVLVGALGAFAYMATGGAETMAEHLAQSGAAGSDGSALLVELQAVQAKILLASVVAVLLMIGISVPAMHFTVARPLTHLADALDRTAGGERTGHVEGEDRGDEIGVMARALGRLRADLVAMDAKDKTAPALSPVPAAADGSPSLSNQVERYSEEMSAYVGRLNSITKRLSEASDHMILAAEHASAGSDQATTASSNAAGDVSSVATASEQLLDSIEEISRQVVQSTSVVKEAVERAVETNAGMGRLSTAAQKVGDVVSLISRIAAQTNLLALNATIEAARAGEAGRGFAVVAQEVKTLATQTAKATQDITGQIVEMQEATEQSVVAIDKIQKKISEVEHISTIIAAAVHEQGAATQEIARNVRSAAAGTASMSGHVEAVVKSVGETSANAASVAALAKEFDELTGTMSKMVHRASKFAQTIRVA